MIRDSVRRLRALAVCGTLLAVAAACTPPPPASSGDPSLRPVDPNLTDPALPSEPLAPNISLPPAAPARDRLVVLFNGTAGVPSSMSRVAKVLAADGYHVIGLRYDSSLGTLDACPNATTYGVDCHRQLRGEVVFGAGVESAPGGPSYDHPAATVTASTSVMNRLLAYVEYLGITRPDEGWDRYRQLSVPEAGGTAECAVVQANYSRCDLHWDRVVGIGFSQGAGVALFLGQQFALDRVGMLSGSFDAFGTAGSYVPAPWLSDPFATDTADIVMFSHPADAHYGRQVAVATAVGLPGPPVNVLTNARPYGHARRLVTDVLPNCLVTDMSTWAHSSTVEGSCTPPGIHAAAWRYLASGS